MMKIRGVSVGAVVVFLAMIGNPGFARGGVVLSFDSQGVNLNALKRGQVFDLLINMTGLAADEQIADFVFGITFGSGAFQVEGYNMGSALTDLAAFEPASNPNSFSFAYVHPPTPVTSDGGLASVRLVAKSSGSGAFQMSGPEFLLTNGSDLAVSFAPVSYSITLGAVRPVPEPSSLILASAGLLLVGLRRRRGGG